MRTTDHSLHPSPRAIHSAGARRAARVLLATTVALLGAACEVPTSSLARLAPTDPELLLVSADATDIRVGAPEGTRADIRGLNNLGQATGSFELGRSRQEMTPYRWTPGTGFTAITPLAANHSWGNDINDAGVVVGTSNLGYSSGSRATVSAGNAMVSLGLLYSPAPEGPPPFVEGESDAYAINNAGLIVGRSWTALVGGSFHAVLWNAARAIQDLGTLGGNNSAALHIYSTARDINASGQVIGMSEIANGSRVEHAFLWTASGGMQDLTTLLGGVTNVVAINDAGQIAGDFTATSGETHAFLFTPGSGLRDLGTLGGNASSATGLNNHGQVVGSSKTTTGSTSAFLWTEDEGMEDITALTGAPEVRKLNDRLQTITGAPVTGGAPRIITLVVVPRAWPFVGFLAPIAAPPAFNAAKAGQPVTVRFSLGGDRGLNIFQAGSPSRVEVSCTTGAPLRAPVTVRASSLSLRYERGSQRYSLRMDSESGWAQRCVRLTLALVDGSTHSALFHFGK
jgi:probable HAF family extracellular repeat protein